MTGRIGRIDGRDPGAFSAVRELLAEAELADGSPPVSDQAVLAASQGEREVLGASDSGGRLDAVGILGQGELDLVVRPGARGRGLGSAMLQRLLDTADRDANHDAVQGAARNEDPATRQGEQQGGEQHGGELRAWQHGTNPAAETLLRRAGFAPVRRLYRLALDPARLPEAIAEARPLPDGFALRDFDPADPSQVEAWVRVNAAAFADHPEQGSMTTKDFRTLAAEPWFDPDDLILAFDTASANTDGPAGRLAGYTWIKTVRGGEDGARPETELYVLGVDPQYAGLGLGAALLGETLRRMSAHDPGRITLYVDGDNESARALYDRAGFTVDRRSAQWLRRTA